LYRGNGQEVKAQTILHPQSFLSRADHAVSVAQLLLENRFFPEAISRLYYACYYAVTPLLYVLGLSAKTHAGVRTLLNAQVIQPGLLPKEYGDFYTKLLEKRHEADYAVMANYEQEETAVSLADTKRFIQAIKQLIEERIGG
jgi:uncharacterized protein (UPF0332 family)